MSVQNNTTFKHLYPNIYVEDKIIQMGEGIVDSWESNFSDLIQDDLDIISTGEVGKRLLKKIENQKHRIYIKYHPTNNDATSDDFNKATTLGTGCGSTIRLSCKASPLISNKDLEPLDNPTYIILAHELIHAYHNAMGKQQSSESTNSVNFCFIDKEFWTDTEEYHTIAGFPSKNLKKIKPKISENSIRNEHKLKKRSTHLGHKHIKTLDKPTLKRLRKEQKSEPVTIVKYFIWKQEWEKAIQVAVSLKGKRHRKEAFFSICANILSSKSPKEAIQLLLSYSRYEEALQVVDNIENFSSLLSTLEDVEHDLTNKLFHKKLTIEELVSVINNTKLSDAYKNKFIRDIYKELMENKMFSDKKTLIKIAEATNSKKLLIDLFLSHLKFEEALLVVKNIDNNNFIPSLTEIAERFAASIVINKTTLNNVISILKKVDLPVIYIEIIATEICKKLMDECTTFAFQNAIQLAACIKNPKINRLLFSIIAKVLITNGSYIKFHKEYNNYPALTKIICNLAIALKRLDIAKEIVQKLSDQTLKDELSSEISKNL